MAVHSVQRPSQITEDNIRFWSLGTAVLALTLMVFCLLEAYLARVKPMWFDEICTLGTSSQPTLRMMFRAEPPDGNPPLMYLLTRVSLAAFGQNPVALRLPEFAGLIVSIVCSFIFVGRRYGSGAGSLAAALVVSSPLADYGVEARPYGLIAGCVGLVLVFWQTAVMRQHTRRTRALVSLGLAIAALLMTHPFGVLYAVVPLLCAETVRCWSARKLDKGVLVAVTAGLSVMSFVLPIDIAIRHVMAQYAGSKTPTIARPTLLALRGALMGISVAAGPRTVWPLALLTSFLRIRKRRLAARPSHRDGLAAGSFGMAVGLSLLIVLLWVLALLDTHYFFQRYTFPASIGVAILLSTLVARVPGARVVLPALALSLLLGFTVDTSREIHQNSLGRPERALLTLGNPTEPLVVASAMDYPVFRWYSDPATRAHLHFLANKEQSLKTADFVPEIYMIAEYQRGLLPYPIEPLEPFLARYSKFRLIYRGTSPEWLPSFLYAHGYTFTPISREESGAAIVEVTAPVHP